MKISIFEERRIIRRYIKALLQISKTVKSATNNLSAPLTDLEKVLDKDTLNELRQRAAQLRLLSEEFDDILKAIEKDSRP